MGSVGGDSDETRSCTENSDLDTGDTQHLEFDSQYSPFCGEENDDILYGLQFLDNHVPLGDTLLANDALETQRLDFDCEMQRLDFDCETPQLDFDGETQRLDFDCETQPLDCAEETQVMDFGEETQVMDFGEETQVLDIEGDFCNNLDTELLWDPDKEETVVASDEDDTDGTEVLTDTEDAADIESLKISIGKSVSSEGMQPISIRSQAEAESKSAGSVHSPDAACSSGSVRRGFTSIRTASLRTSGLSARKKALKKAEGGNASNENGVKSSGLFDEAIDKESDRGKANEHMERVTCESNQKLGKSAARKLVLDNIDIDEHEHNESTSDGAGGEDLVQVHSCTNDLAGLSYVNSQEPGDLSQANALDFVEQFLKDNVCEFDLGARQLNVARGNQNPTLSAVGTQKLAKKVNLRSSLAENVVYDWDDRLEDEGGGEFLTRNKELFFGNKCRAHKSLTEPQKPKHLSRMKKGTNQKSINEECQKINARKIVLGLAVSEPKFTASRKVDQLDKLNIKRNLNGDFEKQACTDSMQVESEAVDPEMLEMVCVGVDTQMAVEAMETLSRGINLSTDGENAFQGKDCRGQLKDKMTIGSTVKQTSKRKRVHASDLGATTRSKLNKRSSNKLGDESKRSVVPQRQPQNARKQAVEGKATGRVKNTAKSTDLNVKEIPAKRTLKVEEKVKSGAKERDVDNNGSAQAKKRCIEKKINSVSPIASRTRKDRLASVRAANAATESADDPKIKTLNLTVVETDGKKRKRKTGDANKKEAPKLTTPRDGAHSDESNHSSGDVQNRSVQLSETGKSKGSLVESAKHDLEGQCITRKRRSNRSGLQRKHSEPNLLSNEHAVFCSPSAEKVEPERFAQGTPKEMEKSSISACTTPVNLRLRTPINAASPVCMGDEYYKLSCKKNLTRSSLLKELNSLTPSGPNCSSPDKGLRKRRDMAAIRVLFSHHLDEDIIRHQNKILVRLGVAAVSSISDATHFVTDEFVRTRNMLEAIAHGKPVVNHLWLESCGQAGCYIDEKNYILRDAKKEKELGFSMPVSIKRASQHPLLEGRRVLITPNTKPGVEILSSLVKAVHGQAFERICRSIYKGDKLRKGLLVLSCEEDYEFCVPLLKKGAEVYSSELLLSSIVIQKLEFERHRLFLDQVKKTRSTIWLKEDGNELRPVTRH